MNVTFDAEKHEYRLNGVIVPSVTQVLGQLKPKFDAETIAKKVAARYGDDYIDVLEEWADKCRAACDLGHKVHSAIDLVLNNTVGNGPASKIDIKQFEQWVLWWNKAKASLTPYKTEHAIVNPELNVAGTVDAIFKSSKTNKFHVFDWKTNGKFRQVNQYKEFMLPPFQDVPVTEYHYYSLQVSLYRMMLEQEYGSGAFGDSWIIHLSPGAGQAYKAVDYRARLAAWLMERPRQS